MKWTPWRTAEELEDVAPRSHARMPSDVVKGGRGTTTPAAVRLVRLRDERQSALAFVPEEAAPLGGEAQSRGGGTGGGAGGEEATLGPGGDVKETRT
eukprot:5523581-Heterocapsa_arctica.AAC.1